MLTKSPDVSRRRDRLVSLLCSLPEVQAEPAGIPHIAFKVRKRIFAYYTYDHHGDGRIALWCRAAPGERDRLVETDPVLYFVPPYVGPRGWVAVRLDTPKVAWRAVKNLAFAAYFLTAPDNLCNPVREVRSLKATSPQRRRTGHCGRPARLSRRGQRHAARKPAGG